MYCNGMYDTGNKFGEPVVTGFARSFGMQVPSYSVESVGETITPPPQPPQQTSQWQPQQMRVEWLKPVMFTAGVGWLEDCCKAKGAPEVGMLVCKMGGPAYRIGEQVICICIATLPHRADL